MSIQENHGNHPMDYMDACKSHYKLHCFSCNRPINRGDWITLCAEGGGMELRPIHCSPNSGYVRSIGARWVHFDCEPWKVWTYAEGAFRRDDNGDPIFPYPSIVCQAKLAATIIQRIWRGYIYRHAFLCIMEDKKYYKY